MKQQHDHFARSGALVTAILTLAWLAQGEGSPKESTPLQNPHNDPGCGVSSEQAVQQTSYEFRPSMPQVESASSILGLKEPSEETHDDRGAHTCGDKACSLQNGGWACTREPDELRRQDRRFYADLDARRAQAAAAGEPFEEPELAPLDDTFLLHSRPTATKTIYLDFDGNTTVGTSWNTSYNTPTITSPAYDPDGNGASFTNNELLRIQRIWSRVAEDFSSFDVNVTTEDPGEAALVNAGGGDTEWGIRVVTTVDNFASCGCGGFAYYNSFNWNYQSSGATDTPVFVFNGSEIGVSGAATHEVGHALNLSHDGTTASNPIQSDVTYYNGHGSGETGWGPIMGSGYYKNVTTWDKGEYIGANNDGSGANRGYGPDDIEVITTRNGFGFRQDDHGDTLSAASSVTYVGPNASDPTLVDIALLGVVEDRTDLDFIQFDTAAGTVNLTIDSYANEVWTSNGDGTYSNAVETTFFNGSSWQSNQGSNLDIEARLYDSAGTLIATSNPTGLSASFSNVNLAAGTYYISVDGTNFGNPTIDPPTGYTDYASIGQYYVTGTVLPSVPNDPPTAVNDSAGTSEDVAVVVSVLANDSDPNGDALTVSSFTQGSNGSVSDNGNGTLTYTPSLNFNGGDAFTYTISDGSGGTDSATVNVSVTALNDAPDAIDDSANTEVGTDVIISVLGNDSDVDSDALSISSFAQGTNGSVSDNGDGTLTYTPNAVFSGTDTFSYTITDGILSDTATVTIDVTLPPGRITVTPTSLTTTEGGPVQTFTIALDTVPTADVTIPISSSDTTEGSVDLSEVVFAAGTQGPITVNVTPVDDLLAGSLDGSQTYSIVTGTAISTDQSYSGLDAADVTVTNEDNDTPLAVTVTASGGTTVTGTASSDHTLTIANDGVSQILTEAEVPVTGGRKPKLGSALEYHWMFSGLSGATDFTVDAFRDANSENDNFAFEYSTDDGGSWNPLVTVNDSTDSTYTATGLSISGDVLVRVIDTDRSPAKGQNQPELDSVHVDFMAFQSIQEDLRPAVSISAIDASAAENPPDTGTFRITVDMTPTEDLVVAYAIAATSTATPGIDFQSLGGTATISADQTFVDVIVTPINDTDEEGTEVVTLALSAGALYRISSGGDSASVSITDDDLLAFVASADFPDAGTVTGDYTATHVDDGVTQDFLEKESSGKPANRYTFLAHTWRFEVSNTQSFTLDATTLATIDTFKFEYSTDNATFVDFEPAIVIDEFTAAPITVAAPGLDGSVYVRVTDTNQESGERQAESILVDFMQFSTAPPPPGPAGGTPGRAGMGSPDLAFAAFPTDPDGSTGDLALGSNSQGLSGTPILDIRMTGPEGVQFEFWSKSAVRYLLERSSDLLHWETIGDPIEGAGGTTVAVDPDSKASSPSRPSAFYRIRELSPLSQQ
jgi:hypothetical protein